MRRQACPVTEISVSTTEISVSTTEISATGLKFSHMNTPAWLPKRNFFFDKLTPLGDQDAIILPCMHSKVFKLDLLVKLPKSTKL